MLTQVAPEHASAASVPSIVDGNFCCSAALLRGGPSHFVWSLVLSSFVL